MPGFLLPTYKIWQDGEYNDQAHDQCEGGEAGSSSLGEVESLEEFPAGHFHDLSDFEGPLQTSADVKHLAPATGGRFFPCKAKHSWAVLAHWF